MVFNGINALRQHVKSDARLHGVIRHGGEAPNVIPDFASRRDCVTSSALLPMGDTIPKPVTTTRLIAGSC